MKQTNPAPRDHRPFWYWIQPTCHFIQIFRHIRSTRSFLERWSRTVAPNTVREHVQIYISYISASALSPPPLYPMLSFSENMTILIRIFVEKKVENTCCTQSPTLPPGIHMSAIGMQFFCFFCIEEGRERNANKITCSLRYLLWPDYQANLHATLYGLVETNILLRMGEGGGGKQINRFTSSFLRLKLVVLVL